MSFFNQCLDHLDHIRYLFRSFLYIHRCHILLCLCNETLRDHLRINTFFICTFDDLIINICKIGYIIYIVSLICEIPSQCVKYDHWSCVSDVDIIIYGRSADIDSYFTFIDRYKFFFCSCKSIKNLHGNPPINIVFIFACLSFEAVLSCTIDYA